MKSPHPESPLHNAGPHHLKALPPIPDEARSGDPVAWAEKHAESLAPDAIKEMEWALKFGSDTARYNAGKDLLAMKGLTTKPKEAGVIPQAMVFVNMGPTAPSGAPILPFMNAAAALPLDTAKAPVTVDVTPAAPPTKGTK